MSAPTTSARAARKDRWIPGLFIAFFVGLVCIEVVFVTIAHRTFSGLVTDYAATVPLGGEADGTQAGLAGWKHALRFERQGSLRGRLVLSLVDEDRRPITGIEITANAEKMSRFPQMLPLRFLEQEPGRFEADLQVPLAGQWFVRLTVSEGGRVASWIDEVEVAP